MNNENTNRRRHYAPEEKVKILRQHLLEGNPISEVCQQHQINFSDGQTELRTLQHLGIFRHNPVIHHRLHAAIAQPFHNAARRPGGRHNTKFPMAGSRHRL